MRPARKPPARRSGSVRKPTWDKPSDTETSMHPHDGPTAGAGGVRVRYTRQECAFRSMLHDSNAHAGAALLKPPPALLAATEEQDLSDASHLSCPTCFCPSYDLNPNAGGVNLFGSIGSADALQRAHTASPNPEPRGAETAAAGGTVGDAEMAARRLSPHSTSPQVRDQPPPSQPPPPIGVPARIRAPSGHAVAPSWVDSLAALASSPLSRAPPFGLAPIRAPRAAHTAGA